MPPPLLKDQFRYNDSINAMELAAADRRFEQLIDRRERLIERSRFGILALNGASLIGVLSSYETLNAHLSVDVRMLLAFFTVGMIFALGSIFAETNSVGNRAAQSYAHLSHLRHMRATLDDKAIERNEQQFKAQLEELGVRSKRPMSVARKLDSDEPAIPNDFDYSPAALTSLYFAGGAWVGGAITVLAAAFGWV